MIQGQKRVFFTNLFVQVSGQQFQPQLLVVKSHGSSHIRNFKGEMIEF